MAVYSLLNIVFFHEKSNLFFQIDAQLGDPTFNGNFKMCRFKEMQIDGNSNSCLYDCTPTPDYCVALYVSFRNIESVVRLCEVAYENP